MRPRLRRWSKRCRLTNLREARELTQEQLARVLRVNQAAVSKNGAAHGQVPIKE